MDNIDHKQNNDRHHQQEQLNTNHQNMSTLIEQIYEELIRLRQDDIELIEQMTSLYNNLFHLRQSLTNPHAISNTDIATIPIQIDSPTSSRHLTKPRSDSEPNILSDRQRIITIIEDFQ